MKSRSPMLTLEGRQASSKRLLEGLTRRNASRQGTIFSGVLWRHGTWGEEENMGLSTDSPSAWHPFREATVRTRTRRQRKLGGPAPGVAGDPLRPPDRGLRAPRRHLA